MKKIEFVFQESPEAGKLYEITEGVLLVSNAFAYDGTRLCELLHFR